MTYGYNRVPQITATLPPYDSLTKVAEKQLSADYITLRGILSLSPIPPMRKSSLNFLEHAIWFWIKWCLIPSVWSPFRGRSCSWAPAWSVWWQLSGKNPL